MSSYAKLNNLCNPKSNLGTDRTIFFSPENPLYYKYYPNVMLVDDSGVDLQNCNKKPLCQGTNSCVKTCK